MLQPSGHWGINSYAQLNAEDYGEDAYYVGWTWYEPTGEPAGSTPKTTGDATSRPSPSASVAAGWVGGGASGGHSGSGSGQTGGLPSSPSSGSGGRPSSATSGHNPWGTAAAAIGVLLADDASGVGVADDVLIVGVVVAAGVQDLKNRVFVTYTLTGPAGQVYAGRTSGFGDPQAIVEDRYRYHHMKMKGYTSPVADRAAGGLGGWEAIRGREQQLIDAAGGVGDPMVGNTIRGVGRANPRGRHYHDAASAAFGELAPYTGW